MDIITDGSEGHVRIHGTYYFNVTNKNSQSEEEFCGHLIIRDWNWPMEYDPEFCIATCVAMENFQPLRRRTGRNHQFHFILKINTRKTTGANANALTCQRWL